MTGDRVLTKADLTGILRRAGMPTERITELLAPLDDPVDLDRDEPYLYRNGVSMDRVIDRMGGSA